MKFWHVLSMYLHESYFIASKIILFLVSIMGQDGGERENPLWKHRLRKLCLHVHVGDPVDRLVPTGGQNPVC